MSEDDTIRRLERLAIEAADAAYEAQRRAYEAELRVARIRIEERAKAGLPVFDPDDIRRMLRHDVKPLFKDS